MNKLKPSGSKFEELLEKPPTLIMKQTAKQTKPETKMVNVTWCYRVVLVLVGVGVT